MRILQVIAGFCMVTFPYFLLYFKFGLKDNSNNSHIFRSTLFYSLVSVALKVLLMATGVPELLAKFLLPEKLVLALLETVSLVGIKFALTSKASLSAKSSHRIIAVGMWWSFVNNFVRCLSTVWKVHKSLDYTNKFFFFSLNANLSVVASLCASCLVTMYLKNGRAERELCALVGAYIMLFPVLQVFAFNEESDVNMTNIVVFVVQAVSGVGFAYFVKHHYNSKYTNKPKK
ncbi:conserved hypothetical protein [Theileria orientalis strain Shintoku]|uniref:BOS complex subunit TMEM147 n=1 Tax=Theileria orientalis strain Shintoku TaxID=869250 RepID=J4C8W6_THEOR|nr:conserved hypothetical protein [Theileria orientalis strain Shintoku]BAM41503.1 conserved hypothetical protein [Theileria orientalis strain Shintoku]|eukprot:XP_009691804.1 conserved hypothetical protein [Theileria orientalis strain Shintoku]